MRRRPHPIEDPGARVASQFDRCAILLPAIALAVALAASAGCDDRDKSSQLNTNPNTNQNQNQDTKNVPAPPRPATAEEMAVIAPLTKGSSLAGWEVVRVEGSERGALRVVCVQKRAVVRLYIALAADDGPAPPATAGKFAIFYSLKDASAEDGERLATELAAVIEKNKDAPPPPGMTPFQPRPSEPISL
jgi:hypothetical protein